MIPALTLDLGSCSSLSFSRSEVVSGLARESCTISQSMLLGIISRALIMSRAASMLLACPCTAWEVRTVTHRARAQPEALKAVRCRAPPLQSLRVPAPPCLHP
jgi:hypothetical protein